MKGLKTVFLTLASSGLRIKELLSSKVDLENGMLILGNHEGLTKRSYVSFFNEEAKRQYLKSKGWKLKSDAVVTKWFRLASKKIGIKITPQVLREWFCCEMGRLGVPDRYVDAFCGRVPRSVLARHYTDFSPERLKEIYDRAGLRVLS